MAIHLHYEHTIIINYPIPLFSNFMPVCFQNISCVENQTWQILQKRPHNHFCYWSLYFLFPILSYIFIKKVPVGLPSINQTSLWISKIQKQVHTLLLKIEIFYKQLILDSTNQLNKKKKKKKKRGSDGILLCNIIECDVLHLLWASRSGRILFLAITITITKWLQ